MVSIDDYTHEEECIYKDERYSARDNGTVLRHPREGKRPRPTDNQWTFGKPNDKHGYMELGSARVHIIVATAFYGAKSTKVYVVDHIDANRRNNRLENLRWLTRLENVLSNPITRKNIEFICGCSAEEFLANPEQYRDRFLQDTSYGWMRTVSAEEGAECLKNRLAWAESDRQPSGGGTMGEWVYGQISTPIVEEQSASLNEWPGTVRRGAQAAPYSPAAAVQEEPDYDLSLTPGAAQRGWRTPSEFPCTPQEAGEDPLASYAANLKTGAIFANNVYGSSLVVDNGFSEDHQTLYVTTEFAEGDGAIKPYALAKVTYEDGLFVHAGRTFFKKEGAEKQLTLAQGLEWAGEDSIDDYC